MGTATDAWPGKETDPQRTAILAAADRLLAGTPRRSTGNLSVVQLAVEADCRYWIVAQKHTDLRDHFQRLAAHARTTQAALNKPVGATDQLTAERDRLKTNCDRLEELVRLYATVIHEITLENQTLREQATQPHRTITPLNRREHR